MSPSPEAIKIDSAESEATKLKPPKRMNQFRCASWNSRLGCWCVTEYDLFSAVRMGPDNRRRNPKMNAVHIWVNITFWCRWRSRLNVLFSGRRPNWNPSLISQWGILNCCSFRFDLLLLLLLTSRADGLGINLLGLRFLIFPFPPLPCTGGQPSSRMYVQRSSTRIRVRRSANSKS